MTTTLISVYLIFVASTFRLEFPSGASVSGTCESLASHDVRAAWDAGARLIPGRQLEVHTSEIAELVAKGRLEWAVWMLSVLVEENAERLAPGDSLLTLWELLSRQLRRRWRLEVIRDRVERKRSLVEALSA